MDLLVDDADVAGEAWVGQGVGGKDERCCSKAMLTIVRLTWISRDSPPRDRAARVSSPAPPAARSMMTHWSMGRYPGDEVQDILEKVLDRLVGDQGLPDPDEDLEDAVLLGHVGRDGEAGGGLVRRRRPVEDVPIRDRGAGVRRRAGRVDDVTIGGLSAGRSDDRSSSRARSRRPAARDSGHAIRLLLRNVPFLLPSVAQDESVVRPLDDSVLGGAVGIDERNVVRRAAADRQRRP